MENWEVFRIRFQLDLTTQCKTVSVSVCVFYYQVNYVPLGFPHLAFSKIIDPPATFHVKDNLRSYHNWKIANINFKLTEVYELQVNTSKLKIIIWCYKQLSRYLFLFILLVFIENIPEYLYFSFCNSVVQHTYIFLSLW